jgi:hypothetical protein
MFLFVVREFIPSISGGAIEPLHAKRLILEDFGCAADYEGSAVALSN